MEHSDPDWKSRGLIAYWAKRSAGDARVKDLAGNGHTARWQAPGVSGETFEPKRAEGYRGIWYSNQPSDDRYRYKYSGGLGTYCAKHRHHAQYASEVNKTFFVYGGTKGVNKPKALQIMISYYDHETDRVPKPALLMNKGTSDAHHNPVIAIDEDGILWVFASAHGLDDGYIFKSTEPYSIDEFQRVTQKEFTYPQPRYVEGNGFLFLFTKYTAGREMYFTRSMDGRDWSGDEKIAGFGGHYQISSQDGAVRGTAFNWHPPKGGLNARTQLYYMQSSDRGRTWETVEGEKLTTPLDSPENPALIRDFKKEGWLVYLKDIDFDSKGRPVILVVRSRGFESGPENDPRIWTIAHWMGDQWDFHNVTRSDHNYDMGSLYVESSQKWRVIAPTEPGPQPYCAGGEIEMWLSSDGGKTWRRNARITQKSPRNHTYVRRPINAHPEFYAFWADGNALKHSISRLYFCDRSGETWRLPPKMEGELEQPKRME